MSDNKTDNGEGLKVCKTCGMPLDTDTKFCVNCGTPIAHEATEQSEQAAQTNDQAPLVQRPIESPLSDDPFPEADAAKYRQDIVPNKTGVFVGGILSFVVMAALLVTVLIMGVFNQNFFNPRNLSNILMSLLIYGSLAFAVVLTTRAKGPDISLGAVMTLSAFIVASMTGSWILGIVIALLISAAIGAINGLFIVFLRVPALIVTLVMAAILRGAFYMMGNGREIMPSSQIRMLSDLRIGNISLIAFIVFAAAFLASFLLVILSKLGKPISKREAADERRISYFIAYILSSVIACLVGISFLLRLGIASPVMGSNYEVFIIFIFAVVTSSKFLDNRVAPIIYAVMPTVLYVLMQNMFNLFGLNVFVGQIIAAVLTLGFLVISYIARKDSLKGLIQRV